MASIAQALPGAGGRVDWLWQWLRDELTPYPGRTLLVIRMVTAATLVMLISMTFRLPYGAYAALFALNLSRESLEGTTRAVQTMAIGFVLAAAYCLVGAMMFLGDPMLRFLWVIGAFFLMFYGLSAANNYALPMRFGYFVIITIPLWDRHIPAEDKVEGTLWALGTLTLASVISLLLEIGYAGLRRGDDLMDPISDRLRCAEEVLRSYAGGRAIDEATESSITRLAMLGTSRLRHLLQRSNKGTQYTQAMGALVALIGRLVDLVANLPHSVRHISDSDRERIGALADRIAGIRRDLENGWVPRVADIGDKAEDWPNLPLLGEIEETVSLIPAAFSGSQSLKIFDPVVVAKDFDRAPILEPGALLNVEHLKFGLKGCLAAGLCYIAYNALSWPEISTSVTTCFLTALSTVGASHQKQILRIAGAIIGGLLIGMGAQVFVLPFIDSISEFTVLFVLVTVFAAWIITSSPRLSYLGSQVAIAFFLINLQEFRVQTSLAIARDRVIGVLLGLMIMWLVFDHLWSAPAAVEMKKALAAVLRLLAQLAREPVSSDLRTAIERSYSLRETINAHFDKVRSLADGVLFEFGPSRRSALELRSYIRMWQPKLRTLFAMRIASLKYRLQLPGFELPDSVRHRQHAYDDQSARTLEEMADRIEYDATDVSHTDSRELLNETIQGIQEESRQLPTGRVQSLITLIVGIDGLTTSLASEIPRSMSQPLAAK